MDPDEYAHSMFAAAAANAERYPGGQGNVLYEYRLRLEGDNTVLTRVTLRAAM
jgi:hypothetical protein